VSQVGTDVPRLGVGALVTREAFLRLGGDGTNEPEFTAIRTAEGVEPETVTARLAGGFEDAGQTTTTWFTSAKPAEIRQLDAAMPYLRGGLIVGYAVLLAVACHALWTCARANRHDLAVLRAVGCTARQLHAVTAWQALPAALAAVLIGCPLGIAVGRWAFTLFADSLAVVDAAATTIVTTGAILVAVLAAIAVADAVAVIGARRIRAAVALREG
jgi:predicted lysophospholipase L1 biosynthesis ABC-type transport system permease subunit